MEPSVRIAVAGASGFVGQALLAQLASAAQPRSVGSRALEIIALSRAAPERHAPPSAPCAPADGRPRVEWRRVDLFAPDGLESALAGVHTAVYLVHSMLPATRLVQGSFAEIDLLCADHFARAAAAQGVTRIIYLGGLIPDQEEDAGNAQRAPLSPHLQSRLEVERVLGAYGAQVTVLRAGLVVGAGGSSFRILDTLVRRLPVMVCPAWTRTRTEAVALPDVVRLLEHVIFDPSTADQIFEVGSGEVVSYAELIARTARARGVKRRLLPFPLFSPRLSRLWVRLITGSPKELVDPLLESLRCEMVAHRGAELRARANLTPTPLGIALREAVAHPRSHPPRAAPRPKLAFSVQRLPVPAGWDAHALLDEYLRWVNRLFRPVLRARQRAQDPSQIVFALLGLTLLVLRAEHRGERAALFVVGGRLARPSATARLEFRCVGPNTMGIAPDAAGAAGRSGEGLAVLYDFAPRLPWLVYAFTQAWLHERVMRAFARHLARHAPGGASGPRITNVSRRTRTSKPSASQAASWNGLT